MSKEIWKDIIDYEGIYQVSDLGNVRVLDRIVFRNGDPKHPFTKKGRVLKFAINNRGYYFVWLSLNGMTKLRTVHQLVAVAFLNHKPDGLKLVVNHKDFNKQNNRSNNLEIITSRENANKKHLKSTSKYTGVCWGTARRKWLAAIHINGKVKQLGGFDNEYDAHIAYQEALINLF